MIFPSMPCAVPTNTTEAPGFCARISRASAMPGRMWPPVPPAAMTKAPRSFMADVHGDSATSCCEMLRISPPAIQEATREEPP